MGKGVLIKNTICSVCVTAFRQEFFFLSVNIAWFEVNIDKIFSFKPLLDDSYNII